MAKNNQSLMEKVKENPGLVVAGLGAILAAGVVLYSSMSKTNKSSKSKANK